MNSAGSGPQIIQTTGPNGQTQFIMIQQAPHDEGTGSNPNQPGGSSQQNNNNSNNNSGGGQDLVDLLRNAQNPDGNGPPGGNPPNQNNGGLRVVQTPQGQIVIPNGQNVPGNGGGGGGYTPTIVQQTPMGTRQIMIQQPEEQGQGHGGPGHTRMFGKK